MFYLLFLNGLRFKSVADLWSLQHTEKAGQENTASDVWVLKRSHVRVQAQVSGFILKWKLKWKTWILKKIDSQML